MAPRPLIVRIVIVWKMVVILIIIIPVVNVAVALLVSVVFIVVLLLPLSSLVLVLLLLLIDVAVSSDTRDCMWLLSVPFSLGIVVDVVVENKGIASTKTIDGIVSKIHRTRR